MQNINESSSVKALIEREVGKLDESVSLEIKNYEEHQAREEITQDLVDQVKADNEIELREADAQVQAAADEVQAADAEVQAAEAKVQAAEAQVQAANASSPADVAAVTAAQTAQTDAQAALDKLILELQQHQFDLKRKQDILKSAKQKLVSAKNALELIAKDQAKLISLDLSKEQSLAEFKEVATNILNRLKALLLSNLETKIKDLKAEGLRYVDYSKSSQINQPLINQVLSNIIQEAQAAETKVQAAEAEVQAAEDKVKAAEAEVKDAETKVKAAEAEVKDADAQVQAAEKEVRKASEALAAVERETPQIEEKVRQARAALQAAQGVLQAANKNHTDAQKLLAPPKEELKQKQFDLERFRVIYNAEKARLDSAKKALEAIKNDQLKLTALVPGSSDESLTSFREVAANKIKRLDEEQKKLSHLNKSLEIATDLEKTTDPALKSEPFVVKNDRELPVISVKYKHQSGASHEIPITEGQPINLKRPIAGCYEVEYQNHVKMTIARDGRPQISCVELEKAALEACAKDLDVKFTSEAIKAKIAELEGIKTTLTEQLKQAQESVKKAQAPAKAEEAPKVKEAQAPAKAEEAPKVKEAQAELDVITAKLDVITAKLEKLQKLSEAFDKVDGSKPDEVEIPYFDENPVKSIKYVVPGFTAHEANVLTNPSGPVMFARPKTGRCEVTFKNGIKMTFHPDKTTEVSYDEKHPNESVEAIVDDTVRRFAKQYDPKTGNIPHIKYDLRGFAQDDPTTKAILEKHLFALTLQKMLVTPLKDANGKLLSYAQKQDLVVDAFIKGGWTSEKIAKTGVNIGSIIVSPDSKYPQDKYLAEVYGKENYDILNSFKKGDLNENYFRNSSTLANLANKEYWVTAAFKQTLIGLKSQTGSVNRPRFIHHHLREHIKSLKFDENKFLSIQAPDRNAPNNSQVLGLGHRMAQSVSTNTEPFTNLRKQGVTKTQIEDVVKAVCETLNQSLKTSLNKPGILDCDYLDSDSVSQYTKEIMPEVEKYGFTKEQVSIALRSQIFQAHEELRAFVAGKKQAAIDAAFSENPITDPHIKKLVDLGFNKDQLKAKCKDITQSNSFISALASQGFCSMNPSERKEICGSEIKRLSWPHQPLNAKQLEHLLDSRWDEARRLVSELARKGPQQAAAVANVGPGPAQPAAATQAFVDFKASFKDDPDYQRLRALGFDDKSIFINTQYQKMMNDYITKFSNGPIQPIQPTNLYGRQDLNTLPLWEKLSDGLVNQEIDARKTELFDLFRGLRGKPSANFAEGLDKKNRSYQRLMALGYTHEQLNKINVGENNAFNLLAKQAPLPGTVQGFPANCACAVARLKEMGYSDKDIMSQARLRKTALNIYNDPKTEKDVRENLEHKYGFRNNAAAGLPQALVSSSNRNPILSSSSSVSSGPSSPGGGTP